MSFLEDSTAVVDTLLSKGRTFVENYQENLMDYLGKDLYNIFESGKMETNMPFGFKSRLDFKGKNLNFQKQFGNNYRFDLDINKRSPVGGRDNFRIGITKKF